VQCGDGAAELEFIVSWVPAEAGSYLFFMDFGDGETTEIFETDKSSLILTYTNIAYGDFDVAIRVSEIVDLNGLIASGISRDLTQILTLEGPEIVFYSEPSPPIFVAGEDGLVQFTTETTNGMLPFTYEWDLGGVETTKTYTSNMVSATFTEVGKYEISTTVTDGCGFTASATMPVVGAEPEEACHPMPQRITETVSSLIPDQADLSLT
jgi:hypothetical protein